MEEIKLELERRRRALAKINQPVITARMRHGGLRTRTQRREIARHRREIARQRESYTRDIKKINEYIKTKQELDSVQSAENGALLNPLSDIPIPKVSLFNKPVLRRMRRKNKLSRLRRYY